MLPGKFKVPIGGSTKAGKARQTIAEIAAQLLELEGEHIEVVPSTAAGKRSIISDNLSELYAICESLEKYTAELWEGGGAATGLATRSSLTDGKVDDEVGVTVGIKGGSEISITIDGLFFVSSCRRTKRVRRADGQCGRFQIHQRQKFNMCFALASVALATLATTVTGVAFAVSKLATFLDCLRPEPFISFAGERLLKFDSSLNASASSSNVRMITIALPRCPLGTQATARPDWLGVE
jgi:hypothetical protein